MTDKQPTRHMTIALPEDIYEEITAMSLDYEISKTKVINSILRGYIKAKRKRERK